MGKDALRIEKLMFRNDQLVRVENIHFIAITWTYGQDSLVSHWQKNYWQTLHPNESTVNDTIDTQYDASYLDYHLEINKELRLKAKLESKHDDFTFPFASINFPEEQNIFDIYVTEYGTALTNILPILFLYLNTVTVTTGAFEP
jgi:hypothetical protein